LGARETRAGRAPVTYPPPPPGFTEIPPPPAGFTVVDQQASPPIDMDARRAASKQAFEANLPSTPGSQIKAVGSQVAADAAGTVHGLIQMAGSGPFGQLELLKNLPANIVHALVDPASGWIDAIRKGDWNAAATSATKILTQTVPAIAGVKVSVEGVAKLAPYADAVRSGAGSARSGASKLQPG